MPPSLALRFAALLLFTVGAAECAATTFERDAEITRLIGKYSIAKHCSDEALDGLDITPSQCADAIAKAQVACPAIIGTALPEKLDDRLQARLVARAFACLRHTIERTQPDMAMADRASDSLWEKIRPRDVDPAIALQNSEFLNSVQRPSGAPRAKVEFHVAAAAPDATTLALTDLTGNPLYVARESLITAADIASVDVVPDSRPEYSAITLHFSEAAAQRLKHLTTSQQTGKMAMLVDGRLEAVLGWFIPLESTVMFSRSYSRAEALRLALRIAP